MAKTNKYTSLNFNDVYENKKIFNTSKSNPHRPSSSISSTKTTVITNSRIHGNMLVLTRPNPKPIAPPLRPSPPPASTAPPPDRCSVESDSISLRPLGRTGTTSLLSNLTGGSVSPKTNKFVPPHLRPGFHGKEEKPEPEVKKQTGFGTQFRQNPRGMVYQVEEWRPKSGGGYERDLVNRPRSSGANRPFSSG